MTFKALLSFSLGLWGFVIRWAVSYSVLLLLFIWISARQFIVSPWDLVLYTIVLALLRDHSLALGVIAAMALVGAIVWGRICRGRCGP